MYKKYFGFNENPFSIAPDPRYLYMSEMHQEALAHLNYGASSDGCIILLTGDVGTGKTTICRCFLERLDQDTDVAVIINPKLTVDELLATICEELQITTVNPKPTTKNYIDSLNIYLLQAHAEGRQTVLVIDEAQNLDLDVLEMLRLLTNFETNKQKLLKIFLLGQSEMSTILTRPDLAQINQRITSRFHLKGLQQEDVEAYINHRIVIAGGGRARLFSRNVIKHIYEITRGVPRLINSLCDRALLGVYTEGKDFVDQKILHTAAQEIFGKEPPAAKQKTRFALIPVFGVVLTALVLGVWLWLTYTPFYVEPTTTAPDGENKSETNIDSPLAEKDLMLSDNAEKSPLSAPPDETLMEDLQSQPISEQTGKTSINVRPMEISE